MRDLHPTVAILRENLTQLGDRQNASGICPVCNSSDGNVTVYRDPAHITLRCWRGSCGAVTRLPADFLVPDKDMLDVRSTGAKHPPARKFRGALRDLTTQEFKWLDLKYGLREDTIRAAGIFALTDRDRGTGLPGAELLLPVYNRVGVLAGDMLYRTAPTGLQAKRLAYRSDFGSPWMAYYRRTPDIGGPRRGPVILVEDQFSALRLYQAGYHAVALLGVSLDAAKIGDLATVFGRDTPLVLMLDPDQHPHACALAKRYPILVPIFAERDPKDLTPKSFECIQTTIDCVWKAAKNETARRVRGYLVETP